MADEQTDKQQDPPEQHTVQVECGFCHTEFKVSSYRRRGRTRATQSGNVYCPTCGKEYK